MAKESVLLFIITVLIIIPITGFANKTIQTTQRIIVIDPGHGGAGNGLVTSGGIKEKTIVLKLAQKIAQKLETSYNVILTRTQDVAISSKERMFTANKNAGDFFLSLHLNHSKEPACFFYYFEPPEPFKQSIIAPKNTWKSQPLLYQSESRQAVSSFLSIFKAHKKTTYFFSKGAPIILLEGATMPAILIEPLSILALPHQPEDIEPILDELSALIAKSINFYFEKKQ
ncbi:N-acetylmuramoyl-L-alanine amidase family protein [Desulfobacula sp.]